MACRARARVAGRRVGSSLDGLAADQPLRHGGLRARTHAAGAAAAAGRRQHDVAGQRGVRADPVRVRLPHQPALVANEPLDRHHRRARSRGDVRRGLCRGRQLRHAVACGAAARFAGDVDVAGRDNAGRQRATQLRAGHRACAASDGRQLRARGLRVQGRRRFLDFPDLRQCLAGGFEQSDRARRFGRARRCVRCRRTGPAARLRPSDAGRDGGICDRRGLAGCGGAHLQGLAGAGGADLRLRRASPPPDAEPGATQLRRAWRPAGGGAVRLRRGDDRVASRMDRLRPRAGADRRAAGLQGDRRRGAGTGQRRVVAQRRADGAGADADLGLRDPATGADTPPRHRSGRPTRAAGGRHAVAGVDRPDRHATRADAGRREREREEA